MSKRRVVIFTEAGQNIGFGHLTRCLALYDEIDKRGIEVILVVFGKEIEKLLSKSKNRIVDWKDLEFLRNFLNQTDYVIIDSYLATMEVYDFCSKNTAKCLYIDDTNRISYPKGVILNPSLSGNIKYDTKNEVLQGKDYIILRKEFTEEKIPYFEKEIDVLIVVVTGKISDDIKKLKTDYIEILSNIEALEMRNLILKTKFIICGCGQSIYEMLALKANFLPILIIDNQEKNKEFLLKTKFVEDVLDYNEEKEKFYDAILKQLFLERNNNIILDVNGSKRVIDFFLEEK